MVFLLGISFVYGSASRDNEDNRDNERNKIVGNGNIITEDRPMQPFEKIQVVNFVSMRYHLSSEYRISITVDSNIIEYVETELINNTLKIGMSKRWESYSFEELIVDIYCPLINDVAITGSGSLELLDKINTPSFKMTISGSGSLNGVIDCDELDIRISGSGIINISGDIDSAEIVISGSGIVDCRGINKLRATISGSGQIEYHGNPMVEITVSGSGKIIKRE
jgi:hypothetical protein